MSDNPIALTPRMERILAEAERIARDHKHHFVGSAHTLLAIMNEDEGVAAQVLKKLQISREMIEQEICSELNWDADVTEDPEQCT